MSLYTRTCRQEIIDAMVRLERRHDRAAFSPSEIVAEVTLRGIGHAESTVRTHIVSAMCVNAPPNHAVRFDDLASTAVRRSGTTAAGASSAVCRPEP